MTSISLDRMPSFVAVQLSERVRPTVVSRAADVLATVSRRYVAGTPEWAAVEETLATRPR